LKAASLSNKTLTLQGSEWYAEHTIRFPIEKTVACINMDLLNIFGRTKDVTFFGSGKSELDDYSAWAAEKQGRTVGAGTCPNSPRLGRHSHHRANDTHDTHDTHTVVTVVC
jgi:Zn-dependent M28 family amino/carboxypeptidase